MTDRIHRSHSFPESFAWGAATAAYQIEGAAQADDKGESVWDLFCRREGAIYGGHDGSEACDHYHQLEYDVELMRQIGLNAYRFSVSWPRVLPEGRGKINSKGLDFYSQLVDRLLEQAIEPYVTLFHWDFPAELFYRGGWLNPDSVDWFADYAATVVRHLSDRVTRWITINELQTFIALGHQDGTHAPGLKLPMHEVLQAGHHALMAHGKAVQAIRATARKTPWVSVAPIGLVMIPPDDSPHSIELARQATFSVFRKDAWNNTWWMDPLLIGEYPEDGLQLYGADVPLFSSIDMDLIRQPLDALCYNHYWGAIGPMDSTQTPISHWPEGHPQTTMQWPVTPSSFYWITRFLHERYRTALVCTENGMANQDSVSLDGKVHDPQRIDFMQRYLLELHRAIREGADVRGYFCWSLMDNFEWAEGYRPRFGLVYVNYQNQQRILKDSASWYAKVIRDNAILD